MRREARVKRAMRLFAPRDVHAVVGGSVRVSARHSGVYVKLFVRSVRGPDKAAVARVQSLTGALRLHGHSACSGNGDAAGSRPSSMHRICANDDVCGACLPRDSCPQLQLPCHPGRLAIPDKDARLPWNVPAYLTYRPPRPSRSRR